ncbi:hypothetical protein KEM52_004734, partial [Ascosphaera acerosa]
MLTLAEHARLVDRALGLVGQRFLRADSSLRVDWPAVLAFLIYAAVFAAVYPASLAAVLLYRLARELVRLAARAVALPALWAGAVALRVLLAPLRWAAVFEPLYVYLLVAVGVGVLTGVVLFGVERAVSRVLAQVALYFGRP